jgi:hypothetical protein
MMKIYKILWIFEILNFYWKFWNFIWNFWVVYEHSSVSIWGVAVRGCYRKSLGRKWRQSCDQKWHQSRDRKWRQPRSPSGSMFCACATGSCAISTLLGPFDRKWPWPEAVLIGSRFCACPAFSLFFSLVVVQK